MEMETILSASSREAEREKQNVALSSVAAGALLTTLKLVIGLMTGSLGILAEAAHSGLDLGAALITFFAVRVSSKPADANHPYGHGRVENLSALAETLLLLITCAWIIYEALQRLLFKTVEIEASVWAFAVMVTSIVVDVTRSRALSQAARKYHSQALEADALHFSTDIWSSLVVILGLILVKVGEWTGGENLFSRADALAALGVALIVIWVSLRLGKRTVDVLLDRAPDGLAHQIVAEACQVDRVLSCGRVRVRAAGPAIFVDMVVAVPRTVPLEQAHQVSSAVEERVRRLVPRADVVVHVEPVARDQENAVEAIEAVAQRRGLAVHDVRVHQVAGQQLATLHLEVDQNLSLGEAHEVASELEAEVRAEVPGLSRIDTHIEPIATQEVPGRFAPEQVNAVRDALTSLVDEMDDVHNCHGVTVREVFGKLFVSMHCVFDADLPLAVAHKLSSQIEGRLKEQFPDVERVVIHGEPPRQGTQGDSRGTRGNLVLERSEGSGELRGT